MDFVIYLKFEFNWADCSLSGSPAGMPGSQKALLKCRRVLLKRKNPVNLLEQIYFFRVA